MCFRDNVWVQDGIVSRRTSCGQPGRLDVFTKISFHYDWIQEGKSLLLTLIVNIREIKISTMNYSMNRFPGRKNQDKDK